MTQFQKIEQQRQAAFKATSSCFSEEAKVPGSYRGHTYDFILPEACADENLFPEIRQSVKDYFSSKKIQWHDGKNDNPSPHLCSSQVCCVNFLFPFVDKPEPLKALLRPIYPTISNVIPMEDSGELVSFEWIGEEDYLGETVHKKRERTRGAHFTSTDAAIMFDRTDNKRQIVLIEWKYTEAYASKNLKISDKGTDRTQIYSHSHPISP